MRKLSYTEGMVLLIGSLLGVALAGGIPAVTGVISWQTRTPVPPNASPGIGLMASDRPVAWAVECTSGEQVVKRSSAAVPAGEVFWVELPRQEKITTAECAVLGSFANGLAERKLIHASWTWAVPDETSSGKDKAESSTPTSSREP